MKNLHKMTVKIDIISLRDLEDLRDLTFEGKTSGEGNFLRLLDYLNNFTGIASSQIEIVEDFLVPEPRIAEELEKHNLTKADVL